MDGEKIVHRRKPWNEQNRLLNLKIDSKRQREIMILQQQRVRDNLPPIPSVTIDELREKQPMDLPGTNDFLAMPIWDIDEEPTNPENKNLDAANDEDNIIEEEYGLDMVIYNFDAKNFS